MPGLVADRNPLGESTSSICSIPPRTGMRISLS